MIWRRLRGWAQVRPGAICLLLSLLWAAPAQAGTPVRVFIDAGHGVGTNQGAMTLLCGTEAAFTLEVSLDLARRLEATGDFVVQLSRTSSAGPNYAQRLRAARHFNAQVLLSLHADVRGEAAAWAPSPGQRCLKNDSQAGFSVLVSDEVSALSRSRLELARQMAGRLADARFLAYDGVDYEGLFESDPTPGVFLDRRGLMMLRRPHIPSVIIETHHALHSGDYALWQTREARVAFADSVAAALRRQFASR